MIIDFHSHMLPLMDDGSKSAEMSFEMLASAKAQGVGVQFLTPHFYPWAEKGDAFLERRENSIKIFTSDKTDGIRLVKGAEVAYFANISRSDLHQFTIENSKWMLFEMPFEGWKAKAADEAIQLTENGYRLILAHVERYLIFKENEKFLEQLVRYPMILQVNASSFFDKALKKKIYGLYEKGLPIVLGSDCHNMEKRPPNILSGRKIISEDLGISAIEAIDHLGMDILKDIGVEEWKKVN